MTLSPVTIQIAPEPSPPSWMGEAAAFAQILAHEGILKTIQERVRFARAHFGRYDLIDFVAILIGYVVSGEPTLLAFYEGRLPFVEPFLALFGRNQVPHRSTLSRFLAALDQVCAPAYQGRKRGEVVRTRTVLLQAHTHQFLGTFGGSGNGDYRGELRRAVQAITSYGAQLGLPTAPLLDVLSAGPGVIARSRAYHLLDHW